MRRYLSDADNSFDDSLRGPLKDLELNDSTGSYRPLSSSKRALKGNPDPFMKGKDRVVSYRRSDNKENRATDNDKLPVYHNGPHGQQLGTLIVRHHAQKDSKSIQCRNCGIFFTVSSFLKHCHDEYGKRAECNAIQLQLGLECPTSQQKQAWDVFQKKMLSDGKESSRTRMEVPRRLNHRFADLESRSQPRQHSAPLEMKPNPQRIRRSSVDLSFRRPAITSTQITSIFDVESSIRRSRELLASSALHKSQSNSLSLSQLAPAARASEIIRDVARNSSALDWRGERENRPNQSSHHSKSEVNLAQRQNTPNHHSDYQKEVCLSSLTTQKGENLGFNVGIRNQTQFAVTRATSVLPAPPMRHDNLDIPRDVSRNGNTRPWDVPDLTSEESFPQSKPATKEDFVVPRPSLRTYDITSNDKRLSQSAQDVDGNFDDCTTESLIKNAICMLEKAALRMKKDSGNNSNAWRKMYEEERDHRMNLEAKVRDLERDLRSAKP